MYSFYGGKQGRTYNLVERYDLIYLNLTQYTDKNGEVKELLPFNPGGTYNPGDRFSFESKIYLVLSQDFEGSAVEIELEDLYDDTKVVRLKGMVNEFLKGGAYTDANYGLYVIIDTILNLNHKNDDINGIIYRRGFDYTEPAASFLRPHKNDKATKTFTNPQGGEDLSFPNLYIYHDYELNLNGSTWTVIDQGFNTDRWVAAWRRYVLKPGGGAIYVGQIVGPQGDAPEIIGLSWEDFLEKENGTGEEDHYAKIQMDDLPGWDGHQTDSETGEKTPIYNDYVLAGYCSIRDKDGTVTGAYVSFKIPQTLFKISAQSVDPYGVDPRQHYDEASDYYDINEKINADSYWHYEDGYNEINDPYHEHAVKKWKYTNLIHQHSRTGILGGHPFYYNFDIAIPNGVHGQDIDTIKLLKGLDIHYVPTRDSYIINGKTYYIYLEDLEGYSGYTTVEIPDPEDIETYFELLKDINNEPIADIDNYITYYIKNYDNKLHGELSKPLGIWPYRVIDETLFHFKNRDLFSNWSNIILPELQGQLPEEYIGFANVGDLYKLTMVKEDLEEEIVKDFIVICTKEGEVGTELLFINNFKTIYEDFLILLYSLLDIYKELLKTQINSGLSKWNFIDINPETPVSLLLVKYKAGSSNSAQIRTVDYFTIDDNGNFYVSYSDSPLLFYLSNIGRIKNINFENSQLTFDFGEYQKAFTVKLIEKIDIENYDNIKLTQRWRIKYKGINTPEYTDGSINSILAIDKMGDNIIILYSDPSFRNSIENDITKIENIDYYFKEWTDPITGVYYDRLLWINLGHTDGTYHILGTTTYDKLAVNSIDNTYKNGLEGSHAGWVVTVEDEDKIKFFAYDYINNTPLGAYTIGPNNNIRSNWFLVSSITDEAINPERIILLSEEGNNDKPLKPDTSLKKGGYWFVISNGHDNYYGENL